MHTQTFKRYTNAAGRNEFIALEKTPKKTSEHLHTTVISLTSRVKRNLRRYKFYFWEGATVSSPLLSCPFKPVDLYGRVCCALQLSLPVHARVQLAVHSEHALEARGDRGM